MVGVFVSAIDTGKRGATRKYARSRESSLGAPRQALGICRFSAPAAGHLRRRFADSGGWGWGAFKYNAASDTFNPATTADTPPQGNDAKCGLGCHTIVKARDFVFTDYGKR
jgi:hypothetical protein